MSRLFTHIKVDPATGCWNWQSTRHKTGYGHFTIVWQRADGTRQKRAEYAHRIMYRVTHGEPPADRMVRHSCDNRLCVNPDHLSLGTHQDNMQDAVDRGRTARGERNAMARLTVDRVREIRRRVAGGESMLGLSRELGISFTCVFDVCHRLTWKWVP